MAFIIHIHSLPQAAPYGYHPFHDTLKLAILLGNVQDHKTVVVVFIFHFSRSMAGVFLNRIQTGEGRGGGLLRPGSTLKLCNFVTVYAITTKFC